MKLKNLFKTQAAAELKNDFKPILDKVTVPVTTYAKSNPKRTLFFMITIVVANILILYFFTDSFKTNRSSSIDDFKFKPSTSREGKTGMPKIDMSVGNIMKVRELKDTLSYLMNLKQMTFKDTLTFIRVTEEFQKITGGTGGLPPVTLEDLRSGATNQSQINSSSNNQ